MASKLLGKAMARAKQLAEPALVKARAADFVQLLKTEYQAGKNGEPEAEPDNSTDGTTDTPDETAENPAHDRTWATATRGGARPVAPEQMNLRRARN